MRRCGGGSWRRESGPCAGVGKSTGNGGSAKRACSTTSEQIAFGTFIGRGGQNEVADNASYSTVGGGTYNYIGTKANLSVVGGGFANEISSGSTMSTIAG